MPGASLSGDGVENGLKRAGDAMKSEGNEMVPQSIQIAELLKHEVPLEPGYQLMKGCILQSGRVGLIV
jgi:hypothetical protein